MTENQGPTPEWMRKHAQQYEPPLVNQETNRRAYRKVSAFETLHKRGEIEYYQLRTAEALERHMYGAQGADVRIGDGGDESPRDMAGGLARAYHAAKVANAEAQLLPVEWRALMGLTLGITTLEEVGRSLTQYTKREVLRARGLGIVSSGLDRLAASWGMSDVVKEKRRV